MLPEEAAAFAAIVAFALAQVIVPAVQFNVGVVVFDETVVEAEDVQPFDCVATTP